MTGILQTGDTNGNSRLDTTETWTFTAQSTVTAGQHTNIATATGTPLDVNGIAIAGMSPITDTDTDNHFGVNAAVNLVKRTNGQVAATAPGVNLVVGATATFTYIVTNTGNVALGTVVVRMTTARPRTPADDFSPTSPERRHEQQWPVGHHRNVDVHSDHAHGDGGQYTNIATVTGNPVDATGADIANVAGCDSIPTQQSLRLHGRYRGAETDQRRSTQAPAPGPCWPSVRPRRSRTT